jgi:hypothetical protein
MLEERASWRLLSVLRLLVVLWREVIPIRPVLDLVGLPQVLFSLISGAWHLGAVIVRDVVEMVLLCGPNLCLLFPCVPV